MRKMKHLSLLGTAGLILCLAACTPGSPAQKTATPTPSPASQNPVQTKTPTPTPAGEVSTPAGQQSACKLKSAAIEVQLSLPYAAAVDLDPLASGVIPLSIDAQQQPTHLQGAGHISYDQTQTWTDDEGKETAEVFLELDVNLDGQCLEESDSGVLQLTLDAVHQEEQGSTTCAYPPGECKDSPVMGPQQESFELEFPLEDGATIEKETWTTWTFVLHLQK